MIMKFLLVVAVIGVVYFLFIKKKPKVTNKKKNKKDENAQTMVECSRCGVYVGSDEIILSNGTYFCSNECLKA